MALRKQQTSGIHVANTSFACDVDGAPRSVRKNETRVSEGDPLLKRYPQWFTPLEEWAGAAPTGLAPVVL